MTKEYENALNVLGTVKKELDSALPAIVRDFSKKASSPDMQRVTEIAKQPPKTLSAVTKTIIDVTAPYNEIAKNFVHTFSPVLLELARASTKLQVIHRLGQVEYVAWKSYPGYFYERAATANNEELLDVVNDYLKARNYADVDETINQLNKNENLNNNPVFIQAIAAYKRGDYEITSLGITSMIDNLLSVYSGQVTDVSIVKRFKKIYKKIEDNGETSLEDSELNDYILITTYSKAIEQFGASSRFDGKEPDLNRHWIMHGRMKRPMKQMDCIRVINFLYGTILLSHISGK